jgi:signal transduction histidine kinase
MVEGNQNGQTSWDSIALVAAVGVGFGLVLLGAVGLVLPGVKAFAESSMIAVLLLVGVSGALMIISGALALRGRRSFEGTVRAIDDHLCGTTAGPDPRLQGEMGQLVERIDGLVERESVQDQDELEALAGNRVLAREYARNLQLLDSLGEGMLAVDATDTILFANRAMTPFLTVPLEEARGQSATECLQHAEVVELLTAQAEEGGGGGTRSVEMEPNDETGTGHIMVVQNFETGDNGDSVGQVLLFQNISRLKNMEALQADFVDSVAHEFRTPLTSIRAYVEMLIDDEAKDPQMKYDFYNTIYEETYRLSELIDNLLNISMAESGSAKLDISPTRLKRLLEEALDVVRPQCEEKNIKLIADLPDRLPTLDVDKKLFAVAVMNVLGNAVKYTPEAGAVTLTTTSHEDGFQIDIRDTGIGIPEDDLSKIFEKFYRSETPEDVQGSGVGLATAQQLVRLHGGDIRVSSQVGEGSTFSIVLPRSTVNTSIGD